MSPTPKELRELVEQKYGKKTLHLYDGYLVIGRDLKIRRWSEGLEDVFNVSEDKMLSENAAGDRIYSLKDFLPGFMSGPEHNVKVLGAFDELDETIATGKEYGTKNMGAKGGTIRKVPAKTIDKKDIEVWIEIGPLFYEPEKELLFTGFVRKDVGENKIEPQQSEEAKAIVEEARPLIISQVDHGTAMVGRKFLGVFGFLEKEVFLFIPEVYRGAASFIVSLSLFTGGLAGAGLIAWHFWGPKPEFRNYNIERPVDRPIPSGSVNGDRSPRQ